MPAAFDYDRKSLTLFPVFEPTGAYEADLARLQALYTDVLARNL